MIISADVLICIHTSEPSVSSSVSSADNYQINDVNHVHTSGNPA